jgi:hypothetical protein
MNDSHQCREYQAMMRIEPVPPWALRGSIAGPSSRSATLRPRAGSSVAEQGTFNPLVVGSNPTRLASHIHAQDPAGSPPTPSSRAPRRPIRTPPEAREHTVTRPHLRRLSVLLATVLLAASCAATPATAPMATQRVCNGISADMGGCTSPRHSFTANTCVDLAKEWAAVLDPALVAILNGPSAVGDDARSVLLQRALAIATVDMNARLRSLNLQDGCDTPEFLAAAEPMFSTRLREGIGAALFDGDPVSTYEDWLSDVRRQLRVIDDGEAPAPTTLRSPPA